MPNELPYQTYERIAKKKWPGGKSPEVGTLLKQYGITTAPGEAVTNLDLQKQMIAGTQQKISPVVDQPLKAPDPKPVSSKVNLSGIANSEAKGGVQYIRGTPIQPDGKGGYSLAGKIIPAGVHVPDFRAVSIPSGQNVLNAPIKQRNFKGVQGLTLVGFQGSANYVIADNPSVLPPITKNSSGVDVYDFGNGYVEGVASVVIKNSTGDRQPFQQRPTNVIENEIRDTGGSTAVRTQAGGGTPAGGGVTPAGATLPPLVPEEGVQARNEAADKANSAAQQILDTKGTSDIDVRDSAKILEDIQDMMSGGGETAEGGEAPKAPSLAELYETKRQELGVEPLETELAGIDSDIEAINANLLVQAEEAGEQLVSMREIGRDKGKLQKEAERNIALLNIEKSAVSRILNNKLNTLKITMDLTGQDFANASTTYQQEFNRSVQLYNMMSGAEERELTHAERAQDDARANLTTLTNLFSKSNVAYADLTDDNKTKIRQLELESGYPEGLTESILAVENQEKEKLFHIVSGDKSQVTIFYEGGESETFNTGIKPTEGAFSETQNQKLEAAGLMDAPRDEQLAHLFPQGENFLTEEFMTTSFGSLNVDAKAKAMGMGAKNIEEMLKAMGKKRKDYAKLFQFASTEEDNIEKDYEQFVEDAFPDYITNTLMPMVAA